VFSPGTPPALARIARRTGLSAGCPPGVRHAGDAITDEVWGQV